MENPNEEKNHEERGERFHYKGIVVCKIPLFLSPFSRGYWLQGW